MPSYVADLFDDDLAWDVREHYRGLLEDKVPDDEATRRVVDDFGDVGDEPVGWLALAEIQHRLGRLDEAVKRRALEVIDTRRGLEDWLGAGPGEDSGAEGALAALRERLVGPQPQPKRVRRPRQTTTDLEAGDVLSCRSSNGRVALFRVLRIVRDRSGATPLLGWLDWSGEAVPGQEDLAGLSVRMQDGWDVSGDDPGRQPQPWTCAIAVLGRNDPDWKGVGFTRELRGGPAQGDESAEVWGGMDWQTLAFEVERRQRGVPGAPGAPGTPR